MLLDMSRSTNAFRHSSNGRWACIFARTKPSHGTEQRRLHTFVGKRRGFQDYYDVLNVSRNASHAQVKAAYFRLSKKYHPDMNSAKEARRQFALISEAYTVLGNKSKRADYDGMSSKAQHFSSPSAMRTVDINEKRYRNIVLQTRQRQKMTGPNLGQTNIYNFDEFYRQHYGQSIELKRRAKEADIHWQQWINETDKNSARNWTVVGFSFVAALILICLTE